ncbi:MAG: AAA family ATPase [Steroidobacteraceae bacterium]
MKGPSARAVYRPWRTGCGRRTSGSSSASSLVGPGGPLRRALEAGKPHSMILWGPPGTGKTTLARLFAHGLNAQFLTLSAVTSGVKDIRAVVEQALAVRATQGTVLFLDEVHRFNKSRQDTFLPYVEDGTLVFIGATTENPSFEVNNALLSRARCMCSSAWKRTTCRACWIVRSPTPRAAWATRTCKSTRTLVSCSSPPRMAMRAACSTCSRPRPTSPAPKGGWGAMRWPR